MNRLRALALLVLCLPASVRAQADTSATLARTPHFALSAALDARPGVFVYRFDAPGWPEVLSASGLPPSATTLALGGLPFEDLITGQARLDLVPLAWLDTLLVSASGQIEASFRPFDAPRPRTEARYLSGPDGFQSIEAVHAQSRRRRLFGQEGQLDALFGYTGRAADNEYPNSRLRRGRATWARLGFGTERFQAGVSNLHTRGTVGAPNGVVPPDPSDPNGIYDRFNASVRDTRARRQTIRNDTRLALRYGAASGELFRTFERLRYSGDSLLTSRAARYGFTAQVRGGGRAVFARGWWQHAGENSAVRGNRSWIEAAVRDTLGRAGVEVGVAAEGTIRPIARIDWRGEHAHFEVEARPLTRPVLLDSGYGPYGVPGEARTPYVISSRLGASRWLGGVRVSVEPFVSQTWAGYDLVESGRDTVRVVSRDVQRAGVVAGLGWRERSRRGLYARMQASFTASLSSEQVQDVPLAHADQQFGFRADLFQRDLRLDLSARLRAWSGFDGHVLHDPTGLLVLPQASVRVPASATLDVVAVGHVRVATLFVAYENVLSGTLLMPGNFQVPEHPLPERRLRFGVFWPMMD